MQAPMTWSDEAADGQRETDLGRWRSTYDLMAEHVEADPAFVASWQQLDALAHARDVELRADVEAMIRRPDIERFAEALAQWG